ncbi:hypothetical protein OUZ56_002535 [Daphnia magna]|uniref:GMP synthase n=1 Tax=Daphnia magna TaxID=35525 RepID=A0ABR0A606_9CRUS|nr:hypothetical protein OUZ56_002535 [Daphnia magna]
MEADFVETQVLIRLMVDYANMAAKEHVLLNRIEIATLEEERLVLEELSSRSQYVATLLNIRIVGVKGFMTGLPAIPDTYLPQEVLDKMVEVVLTVPGIFMILYDPTAKPPWTTEWE